LRTQRPISGSTPRSSRTKTPESVNSIESPLFCPSHFPTSFAGTVTLRGPPAHANSSAAATTPANRTTAAHRARRVSIVARRTCDIAQRCSRAVDHRIERKISPKVSPFTCHACEAIRHSVQAHRCGEVSQQTTVGQRGGSAHLSGRRPVSCFLWAVLAGDDRAARPPTEAS